MATLKSTLDLLATYWYITAPVGFILAGIIVSLTPFKTDDKILMRLFNRFFGK